MVAFSQLAQQIFADIVLAEKRYVDLILSEAEHKMPHGLDSRRVHPGRVESGPDLRAVCVPVSDRVGRQPILGFEQHHVAVLLGERLGHSAAHDASANHGHVVDTGDCDGDDLCGRPVRGDCCKAVRKSCTVSEALDGGLRIVG